MQFDTIELAIEALRNGESIIVVDDEDRENEGDLVAVTEWMDDNTINFMAKEGRGLICAPIDKNYNLWSKITLIFMAHILL